MLEGVLASIGSVGDAYDNALAETTIGLFKTEAITHGNPFHPGPFKTIEDIEFATMGWVDWFNNRRLHSTLDYMPPAEYESNYYATDLTSQPEISTLRKRQKNPNSSLWRVIGFTLRNMSVSQIL